MVIRTAPQGPAVLALGFLDRQVIDAGQTTAHETVLGELPVFIGIGPEPMPRVIMPLIREAHRDAGVMKGPELFDEAVVQLFGPFALEKLDNSLAPHQELAAVTPRAVHGIGQRNPCGVAGVPGVFGQAYLLGCRCAGEGRQGRTARRVHRHGLLLGALLHGLFRNVLTGVRPLVCVYSGAPHLSTAGRQGARLLHGQLYPQARALVGATGASAAMTLMPPISVDAGGS